MSRKPEKKQKPAHRPMPEDPRQLAQVMVLWLVGKLGKGGSPETR